MGESAQRSITFDGTKFTGRPEVLALATSIVIGMYGGMTAEFRGTADQLVGAGIAERSWFDIGDRGRLTRFDEHGGQYRVSRRPRGRWDVRICTDLERLCPIDWPKTKAGKEVIPALEIMVGNILKRFARAS